MTGPLRRLEDKDMEFQWLPQHSLAMNTIKKFLTEAPVLRYYDVSKPITVQCEASQSGLGAVLLQEGQPVCYASRALTDTESRYAQIEKEMLAITWSCDKFDQYLYGRDIVNIETDHEPLKSVFKKEIHKSQKRLQRMRLALQKYNLDVQNKKPLMERRRSSVRFMPLRQLIMKRIFKLNRRNETFSVNKLLRTVISRNLSVLSSQDGLKEKNALLLSNRIKMSEAN